MKKQKEMKNKKKQFKKSSGITLIALVITIVVLIILATVSINMILNDDGIIGAAELAKELQEIAGIKEEAELTKLDLELRSSTEEGIEVNKDTLLQALKNNFEGSTIEEDEDKVIVHNGKYEIIVDDDLNITVQRHEEITIIIGNIELDKEEIPVTLTGDTEEVTITATLTNLDEKDLKWTTSDSNIAEIQGEGKTINVILKSKGEVTITATCGKYSASCKITVKKKGELNEGALLSDWNPEKVKAIISEDNVTVPVPIGYTYSMVEEERSVSTGFVIKKGTNGAAEDVNEFVWVPVSDASFNEMFATSSSGALYLSGQSGTAGVKTEYYSKLRIRAGDSYTLTKPGDSSGVREPDLLTSYDKDSNAVEAGYTNKADMAQGFVDDYKNMRESIKKYKGFYIGRYELTGTVDNPTVQSGAVLTASSSQAGNWYRLYKACRNVAKQGETVTSTMIWGCQWDETMNWLKNTKFKNDKDAVDTDSKTWGNYSNSSENAAVKDKDGKNAYGSPQITGYSKEYWSANNICDLAGNYYEFTQEANSADFRIYRGGYYHEYGYTGSSSPASGRSNGDPLRVYSYGSTRATLYVNP